MLLEMQELQAEFQLHWEPKIRHFQKVESSTSFKEVSQTQYVFISIVPSLFNYDT